MQEIISVNNSTIKEIRKLDQKKYRYESQNYLIEGFHLVTEALQVERHFRYLLGTPEALEQLAKQVELNFDDPRIIKINDVISEHLSHTQHSQNIFMVLKMHQPRHFNFDYGKWILLDNLSDPGNVGTIILTADAAGFDGVILSSESVDLYNPKVQRAMQGSQFHLGVIKTELSSAITSFKLANVPVLASVLDPEAKPLDHFKNIGELALIIGNEAHGIRPELVDQADQKLYIPIKGKAESLNAAVAAGIMIYHFA